jgi:hypothetical protein
VVTFGPRLQYIKGRAVYLLLIPHRGLAEQFGLILPIDQIGKRSFPDDSAIVPDLFLTDAENIHSQDVHSIPLPASLWKILKSLF